MPAVDDDPIPVAHSQINLAAGAAAVTRAEQHCGIKMHMHLVDAHVKAFGFLSFGHYAPMRGSQSGTAAEMIRQAVDLGVGADELGVNGAYFRVHHFAPQQASPMPLLSAIAAKTERIEVGTGVIDMRYPILGL